MNTDNEKIELSEVNASGGVKLGSVRYVLVISLVLAGLVGMIIWNIFSMSA
jgi:hypothetical protein